MANDVGKILFIGTIERVTKRCTGYWAGSYLTSEIKPVGFYADNYDDALNYLQQVCDEIPYTAESYWKVGTYDKVVYKEEYEIAIRNLV